MKNIVLFFIIYIAIGCKGNKVNTTPTAQPTSGQGNPTAEGEVDITLTESSLPKDSRGNEWLWSFKDNNDNNINTINDLVSVYDSNGKIVKDFKLKCEKDISEDLLKIDQEVTKKIGSGKDIGELNSGLKYFSVVSATSRSLAFMSNTIQFDSKIGVDAEVIKSKLEAEASAGKNNVFLVIAYTEYAIEEKPTPPDGVPFTECLKSSLISSSHKGDYYINDKILVGGAIVLGFSTKSATVGANFDYSKIAGASIKINRNSIQAYLRQYGSTSSLTGEELLSPLFISENNKKPDPLAPVSKMIEKVNKNAYIATRRFKITL